jgi:quinohemoprotein ethanol dehydrogenase
MAYSPENGLVYIPATIIPLLIKLQKGFAGGIDTDFYYGFRPDAKVKARGELVAWDPVTQTAKWRAGRTVPTSGGVLATAGNLVFQGTGEGMFEAFAADTGKKLWSYNAGGTILAAPTAVTVDGVQYIIVASGNGGSSASRGVSRLITTRKAQGPARLLAFRIGGTAKLPLVPRPPFPKPALAKPSAVLAAEGRKVFNEQWCGVCHGAEAEGINPGIPDLRKMSPETTEAMRAIVIEGAFRSNGMPSFPKVTDAQLTAMRAFIMQKAWMEYEADQEARNGK